MVKNFLETSPSEWDPLDQGQFARGSVVPGEPAFGEVVLVGSGVFENPENPVILVSVFLIVIILGWNLRLQKRRLQNWKFHWKSGFSIQRNMQV